MLYDIFSSFDDHNFVFSGFFYLVWVLVFFVWVNMFFSFWVGFSLFFSFIFFVFSVVGDLVFRSLSKEMGGSFSLFFFLFLVLVFFNLSGLFPYVFSVSSHLAINLGISLPLWLSIVLVSLSYDFVGFVSHLQPLGSPVFLNPFLCLIELVSNLVRPLTLSVRLTANLSTGHILMGLCGMGFVGSGYILGLLIFLVGLFYFMFELGVCFVQAYIFTLLPSLYSDEHPVDF